MKRYLALTAAAVVGLGCRSAGDHDLPGDWCYRISTRVAGKPADLVSCFELSPEHRFAWLPLGERGLWALRGSAVILMPSRASSILELINGHSPSRTNGIPDVVLAYSRTQRTLTWVSGAAGRRVVTLVMQKGKPGAWLQYRR